MRVLPSLERVERRGSIIAKSLVGRLGEEGAVEGWEKAEGAKGFNRSKKDTDEW